MKRKNFSILLILIMLIGILPIDVFAARHTKRDIQLSIIVNDHYVMSDVYPFIENNRTYVPIRFIAEELGYDVAWNGKEKKVTITNEGKSVELKVDSKQMKVNGNSVSLDAPARLRDDRTFVPLRAIAEAFGINVNWSNDYKSAFIGDNPKYNKFYPVVYYYGNEKPVISDYKINVATYKMQDNSGNERRFETLNELLSTVDDAFIMYYETGQQVLPVKNYDGSEVVERTNQVVVDEEALRKMAIEEQQKQLDEASRVAKEKQLKDEYYVEMDANDPLVGSWYGPSSYITRGQSLLTDDYVYITSMGNNQYKMEIRTILASDNSSQGFLTQYGTYDPDDGILYVERSKDSYNNSGVFAERGLEATKGYYYLEKNGTKLSWKQKNSQYHYDKY